MTIRRTHRALTLAAILTAGLALTGCTTMADVINRESTQTFSDKAALDQSSSVDAAWVPADATAITVRTPSDATSDVAVVLVASQAKLPAPCQPTERRSAPLLSIDGAPDVYDPKAQAAFVCGDWTVMPAADGWFGWTPNVEDQAG